jgi:hypothetical protein
MTGVCSGLSRGLRDGVYVIADQGAVDRVRVPSGSYYFQMWS